jgi:hypothetical protein
MSKIWYSISLSTWLARQVDFTFTLLKQSSDAYTHANAERSSVVGRVILIHNPERKGKSFLGWPFGAPGVCVRFVFQGEEIRFESSISHSNWDCLILLPHRVTRGTMALMKLVGWLIVFHHVWLEIDAHLGWLIELEYGKLKYEIKDLLFVAFQQKENLEP